MTFLNLPNEVPAPNDNNLTAEAEKYYQLYNSLNRTDSGVSSFTSSSSGKTYSTNDYPSDTDVYNKGQKGVMNLLYKYVLRHYIVTSDIINNVIERSDSIVINAEATYDDFNQKYNLNLEYEPTSTVYSVRFKAPNNYIQNSKFNLKYQTSSGEITDVLTPVLSGTTEKMPDNAFVKDRIIIANADRTTDTLTFNSSTTDVFIKSSSQPTSDLDKTKIWLNTTNGTLNYWDGSKWVGIIGVWG